MVVSQSCASHATVAERGPCDATCLSLAVLREHRCCCKQHGRRAWSVPCQRRTSRSEYSELRGGLTAAVLPATSRTRI